MTDQRTTRPDFSPFLETENQSGGELYVVKKLVEALKLRNVRSGTTLEQAVSMLELIYFVSIIFPEKTPT